MPRRRKAFVPFAPCSAVRGRPARRAPIDMVAYRRPGSGGFGANLPAVPRLAELIDALDGWYPPASAEAWDAVGLSCGDPAAEVARVLLAVDCVPVTVAEAIGWGAGLLLTHHPLLLS